MGGLDYKRDANVAQGSPYDAVVTEAPLTGLPYDTVPATGTAQGGLAYSSGEHYGHSKT